MATTHQIPLRETLVRTLTDSVPGCLAVYGFGSWGTEHERHDSDIDLAVLALQPLGPVRRWELAQTLASIAGRDVDLVDLLSASTVLRMEVVAHGELLYGCGSSEVEQFADTVFSSYARLNEERRDILSDVLSRGSIYGK